MKVKTFFIIFLVAVFPYFSFGKIVYILAENTNNLVVVSGHSERMDQCSVEVIQLPTKISSYAKAYSDILQEGIWAQCQVRDKCEFVMVKIYRPGYEVVTSTQRIQKVKGREVIELGSLQFKSIALPKVEKSVLARDDETSQLSYQVAIANQTEKHYLVDSVELELRLPVDFNSLGLHGIHNDVVIYKFLDTLAVVDTSPDVFAWTFLKDKRFSYPFICTIRKSEIQGELLVTFSAASLLLEIKKSETNSYIAFSLPTIIHYYLENNINILRIDEKSLIGIGLRIYTDNKSYPYIYSSWP